MDEILLRRLLGAATLLALALLFAALLPGPESSGPGDGVVAYDLRTGEQLGVRPPVEHPPDLKPEESLAARTEEPAPEAAPAPLPPPALKVDESLDRGGWYVQIGSFSSQANARGALQKLYGMGLPTAIQSVSVGKTLWYRVRVGPYKSEGEALPVLARVRKNGYSTAKLVRPEATAPPKGN